MNSSAELPLGAAYYVDNGATNLGDILSVYERTEQVPGPTQGNAFHDDFSAIDPAWAIDSWVTATSDGDRMKLEIPSSGNPPTPYGFLTRTVTVDLDVDPMIEIAVPETGGGLWSLKVTDGSAVEDTLVLGGHGTSDTGTFRANLQQLTGWEGVKTFSIKLAVINTDMPVYISDLRMTAFRDDFSAIDPAWEIDSWVTATSDGDRMKLEIPSSGNPPTPYGFLTRTVTVDLDVDPMIEIAVPETGGGLWSLKVTDGSAVEDTLVLGGHGTSDTGTFRANLQQLTGWEGVKTFSIKLAVINTDMPVYISDLRMHHDSQTFHDDFSAIDPAWAIDSWVTATSDGDRMKLEIPSSGNPPTPYGFLTRTVTVDLDVDPMIEIAVPETGGGLWSLKVTDGSAVEDTLVLGGNGTSDTGTFSADLQQLTGWEGVKTFSIKLAVVNTDMPVYISDLRMYHNVLSTAESFDTSWQPHELGFQAQYASGLAITGREYFHDADSFVRSFTVDSASVDANPVVIAGQYQGSPSWDSSSRTLTFQNAGFSYAITIPQIATTPEFFSGIGAVAGGGEPTANPGDRGAWAVELPGSLASGTVVPVGIGFSIAADGASVARDRAVAASSTGALQNDPTLQKQFWDQQIAEVPRPLDFSVRGIDAHGMTAADIRRMYYTAWVFIAADLLPETPETGYPYPQMATGKPSLFLENADRIGASAFWESLFGAQFLSYIDPANAAATYRGLMSEIPQDGAQPGEVIPTRKAQTAWIVANQVGDLQLLEDVYPAIRATLLWSEENPRWICAPCGYDHEGEWDINFAGQTLVDIEYAIKIAEALGYDDEVTFWEGNRAAFLEEYKTVFWGGDPAAIPVESYFPNDPTCSQRGNGCPGWDLWVAENLHVAGLTGGYVNGLITRFNSSYDPQKAFAGFNLSKYSDYSYTLYGALDHGLSAEADVMVNAFVRDVTRTNSFAEYYQPTNPPTVGSIVPDVMGAAGVIDFVWMNNGYRMDQGTPQIVRLPNGTGGVHNIQIAGETLNIDLDSQGAALSGSYISAPSGCTVAVAIGATVEVPASCVDTLARAKTHISVRDSGGEGEFPRSLEVRVKGRGAPAEGEVEVSIESHASRRVALHDGEATIVLPTLDEGTYEAHVAYLGEAGFEPSEKTVSLKVS